jgi:hypothetical protein
MSSQLLERKMKCDGFAKGNNKRKKKMAAPQQGNRFG